MGARHGRARVPLQYAGRTCKLSRTAHWRALAAAELAGTCEAAGEYGHAQPVTHRRGHAFPG